jgi:hypothetical protein
VNTVSTGDTGCCCKLAWSRKLQLRLSKKTRTCSMRATNATSVLGSVFGFTAVLAIVLR